MGKRPCLIVLPMVAQIACGSAFEPAFDEVAAVHVFDRVEIAEPDDALTFARIESDGVRRVIAVTRYEAGTVEGVDLSAALGRGAGDPIDLFLEQGYDRLRSIIEDDARRSISIQASDLIIPVDLRDHHVAAGTNYAEHAGDAGTEIPFLFPKLVEPTGPDAPVSAGNGLLDYEVELAWVTLEPLAEGDSPSHMGVVVCNDYTDRETLFRHLDPRNIESGKGFATGKSFPGYLPVGNLFVIPRDFRAFTASLELRLYVNAGLRQRAAASEMIWDFDRIVAETWARRNVHWEHRGRQVSLLGESEVVPARTLILSGTPHGTVFAGIRARHMIAGLARWLAGGWTEPIPKRVIDAYIKDARAAGAYLQPGDEVVIHADRLGVIRNRVTLPTPSMFHAVSARARDKVTVVFRQGSGQARAHPLREPQGERFPVESVDSLPRSP
jgi:2,4-diketo-3-deoxy-L-fuconate hydrolase